MEFDLHMALVILAAAAATFATRIGGYILITRMKSIPPRMEAALNAVPAAVLTTLVAPAFFIGGWESKLAL
ncbi:AzlD family protein, partial [Rhizobium ruizarguesonis]